MHFFQYEPLLWKKKLCNLYTDTYLGLKYIYPSCYPNSMEKCAISWSLWMIYFPLWVVPENITIKMDDKFHLGKEILNKPVWKEHNLWQLYNNDLIVYLNTFAQKKFHGIRVCTSGSVETPGLLTKVNEYP